MALTDGRFRARHTLRLGGTTYKTGDLILGSAFADEDQVKRYFRNGHIDMQAASAAEVAGGVAVEAEGASVLAAATTLNFVGATVTDAGSGQADIEFAGLNQNVIELNGGNAEHQTYGTGPNMGGFAMADGAGASAFIQGWNEGAFAHGYAKGVGGDAYIKSGGQGAVSMGHSWAGSGGWAYLNAAGDGSVALGQAKAFGGSARLGAAEYGAAAFGYCANSGPGTSRIYADFRGSVAFGHSKHNGSGTGTCEIHAKDRGSIAMGMVSIDGSSNYGARIYAEGYGALAWGRVRGYTGQTELAEIRAADGAFAGGYCDMSRIYAGFGAFAWGYADGAANKIQAYNSGCVAMGYANTGPITAQGTNAMQFGPGVNTVGDSLAVGNGGLRLRGKASDAPANLRNGDIWVDASGDVCIQTGGLTKVITALT